LAEYPLCEQGQREGLIEPAAMTDHITPVDQGGDFWDPANHQSLCDRHHRVKSGRELVAKLNGSRA
jgi:5-methylcytosine-specific restriction endonuclease McrA